MSEYRLKIGHFARPGSAWPKILGKGVAPPTTVRGKNRRGLKGPTTIAVHKPLPKKTLLLHCDALLKADFVGKCMCNFVPKGP